MAFARLVMESASSRGVFFFGIGKKARLGEKIEYVKMKDEKAMRGRGSLISYLDRLVAPLKK